MAHRQDATGIPLVQVHPNRMYLIKTQVDMVEYGSVSLVRTLHRSKGDQRALSTSGVVIEFIIIVGSAPH